MQKLREIYPTTIFIAVVSTAAIGVIAGTLQEQPLAFGQTTENEASTGVSTDAATMANGNTTATTTAQGNNILSGAISGIQLDEMAAPAWITSGHWELQSDAPLFRAGNGTGATNAIAEPTVTDFQATIYMVMVADGTGLHKHEISDFQQTGVLYDTGNVTIVNGTMTITMPDGPHENVFGYINLQNDKISVWANQTQVEEHFGPTPIYGIIFSPEQMQGHQSRNG
jgi:hypothetical protein